LCNWRKSPSKLTDENRCSVYRITNEKLVGNVWQIERKKIIVEAEAFSDSVVPQ
jgi:hypothetical protein